MIHITLGDRRSPYAIFGTDMAWGTTMMIGRVRHARAKLCPVLTPVWQYLLRYVRYWLMHGGTYHAISGTDFCTAVPGAQYQSANRRKRYPESARHSECVLELSRASKPSLPIDPGMRKLRYLPTRSPLSAYNSAICLRARYEMSGTDIGRMLLPGMVADGSNAIGISRVGQLPLTDYRTTHSLVLNFVLLPVGSSRGRVEKSQMLLTGTGFGILLRTSCAMSSTDLAGTCCVLPERNPVLTKGVPTRTTDSKTIAQ
eukprot:2413778-Rhodomonas_salina.2